MDIPIISQSSLGLFRRWLVVHMNVHQCSTAQRSQFWGRAEGSEGVKTTVALDLPKSWQIVVEIYAQISQIISNPYPEYWKISEN